MFNFLRRKDESKARHAGIVLSADREEPGVLAPSVSERVEEAIQGSAGFTITSAASESEVVRALERIRRGENQGPVIWELHTGLLDFVRSVFPSAQNATLYGQVFVREPEGRGAHFDVYDEFLDIHYPWVALFNLAGDAIVCAYRLPDQLAKRYALTHPEASEEAYAERRRLADEALAHSSVHPEKGMLSAGCGLIIPQQPSGPEWVHNIVPMRRQNPGRFVKFVVSRERSAGYLLDRGYVPLDGLLTHALLKSATEGSGDSETRARRRCKLDFDLD
jgi:hypothetical protein